MTDNGNPKIKILLESRERLMRRLKHLQSEYEQEKENEDAWPGHDTNFLLQIQQDEQLASSMLKDIEKALKELDYED